ncbi:Hsk1-Dfp1 kinase complex regulatory subunit Dfp1 [Schizosaccharomyces japonicus yFS275]|uniref:Hsk1-Dfp1 kinase complex regulatory subunit Dfp1 n=1 Tax=Schizosaccharomyces japonicus (strain yFS275 / FY16936) TaxID=402676 RepID=B6K4Y0_SCHJY|nr:Hsk1-Dfp1 kinase complex regulatory subunit Dfp1 [Schizosaccharomyces japonicus yFS275]EEB08537.1 Hsk1-Dfp1 kinase complex regulatory subunit Dfp1 [Schizosaccharomyces japonicus yFS275]
MTVGRCPLAPRSTNIIAGKHETVEKREHTPIEHEAQVVYAQDENQTKDQDVTVEVTPKRQTVLTPVSYRKPTKRIKHDVLNEKNLPLMKQLTQNDTAEEPADRNVAAATVSAPIVRASNSQKARLQEWRRQYRKAFPSFHFYLDSCEEILRQRLTKHIELLGGSVETFFSTSVTHVATTRDLCISMSRLSKHDVLVKARQLNMKVWAMEKLNRVLRTLLEGEQPVVEAPPRDLSYLLYVEKVQGTNERDLSAPRQDFVHFKGPFLLVHDADNLYKPILLREWPKPLPGKDVPWPTFRATSIGRCPFIPETRRRLTTKLAAYTKYNQVKEPQAGNLTRSASLGTTTPAITTPRDEKTIAYGVANLRTPETPSVYQVLGRKIDDGLAASGISQSNLTSVALSAHSAVRYGSNPNMPLSASKGRDMIGLKKRIIQQKSNSVVDKKYQTVLQTAEQRRVRVDSKPGYCENCREKFESFELHIRGKRHRQFAENQENFKELDELFILLQRPLLPH